MQRRADCGEQAPGHVLTALVGIGLPPSNYDIKAGEEMVGRVGCHRGNTPIFVKLAAHLEPPQRDYGPAG